MNHPPSALRIGVRFLPAVIAAVPFFLQPPASANWRMAGDYPLIAGKWSESEKQGIFVTIQQDGNKFVANCTYKNEGVEVHWRAEGTISKDGEITASLVHTRPAGYGSQTRTGKLDPDGKTLHGHAKWDNGGHDFTWELKEPHETAAAPMPPTVTQSKLFVGQWDCRDIVIILNADFTAHNSLRANQQGKWECVNGEARIVWDNGVRNVLRRDGEGFRKLKWNAGVSMDSPPSNSSPAMKKGFFVGQFDCGDVVITLNADFTARKNKRNPQGKWEFRNGEARIVWDDGVRNVLRRVGEGRFQKLAWKPNVSMDSPPFNTTAAVKKVGPPNQPVAVHEPAKATQTVIAEGVGANEDEALKDAFRVAVRQVVGAVVDAETLVKNDDVVKDQVLTYSDGFIKEQKVISTKKDGGLVRTTIQATVERRKVIQKLQAANVTVKKIEGQSLFAEAVTQQEAKGNATALLKKALADLPTMLTAEMAGKPNYDAGKGEAVLQIRIKPDRKAFDAFRERLEKVLEKIAVQKDSVLINGEDASRHMGKNPEFPTMFRNTRNSIQSKSGGAGTWCIWLNTFNNATNTTTRWNTYVLDANPVDSLAEVFGHTRVVVSLLDSAGAAVIEDEFVVETLKQTRTRMAVLCSSPVNYWYDKDGWQRNGYSSLRDLEGKGFNVHRDWHKLLIAPYWIQFDSGCSFGEYATECRVPRRVKLTLDELKRITDVRCKVTFRPAEDKQDNR